MLKEKSKIFIVEELAKSQSCFTRRLLDV